MRQQRGKAWCPSAVGEGVCDDMQIPAYCHAGPSGPLIGRKTSESSLAACYLPSVGVRTQGRNLSPTPACKQTKYRGKDEV